MGVEFHPHAANNRLTKGENMRIAIIDSGIFLKHPKLQGVSFEGVSLNKQGDKIKVTDDIEDVVGHGTAVTGILVKSGIEAQYFILKVFLNESMTVDPDVIISALQYIYDHVPCEFILMSLGATVMENPKQLEQICESLNNRGTQIVSAFDNFGCLSYPACLQSVLGVESANHLKKSTNFEIIDGDGVIDIRAKGGLQRVYWANPLYRLVTGNSFAAAHALPHIVAAYNHGARGKKQILNYLRLKADQIICDSDYEQIKGIDITSIVNNAIVYPYNKEIETLLRYSDALSYSITHVCDEPMHGQINKVVPVGSHHQVIESIHNVWKFQDFDTVILGHLSELSFIIGKDLLKSVLERCVSLGKNVYAFDDIYVYPELVKEAKCKGINFYSSKCNLEYPWSHLGRLWCSAKPIVGVLGTSSRQGKFSVQLMLRDNFIKMGYTIRQLGTEPSSMLAGFDKMYPIGYEAELLYRNEKAVMALNEAIHQLEASDPDLIIVGGQSCTLPYQVNHIYDLAFSQWDFIVGTSPDLVVLCVNPQDEVEYIIRTIRFIESIVHCKVISLVLFPMELAQEWAGFSFKSKKLDNNAYSIRQYELQDKINLPVYKLDNDSIKQLCEHIIDLLST